MPKSDQNVGSLPGATDVASRSGGLATPCAAGGWAADPGGGLEGGGGMAGYFGLTPRAVGCAVAPGIGTPASAGGMQWGSEMASTDVCAAYAWTGLAAAGGGNEPRAGAAVTAVRPTVASAAAEATEKIGFCGQLPEPLQHFSA